MKLMEGQDVKGWWLGVILSGGVRDSGEVMTTDLVAGGVNRVWAELRGYSGALRGGSIGGDGQREEENARKQFGFC
ncbi:hypothetical protein CASFOL_000204 [Castilleja foliolosa]|uniref:Uncharacterized protein n=1 Tax=Castilleja foliolosa TaxID=1961234 RepID=A0ABD3EMZ8_9LAMI